MAIPFNLPEDQNEVEVIINQLQSLLTKLHAAIRSRGLDISTTTVPSTRVRTTASTSRCRSRDGETPSTSSTVSPNFSDLFLQNLTRLATVSQEAAASQLTANSIMRSPRRRTSSESSCCEETKISITAIVNHGFIQDWNQEDVSNGLKGKIFQCYGFLLKLLPGPVSTSLWTAVICFMGWHMFRER